MSRSKDGGMAGQAELESSATSFGQSTAELWSSVAGRHRTPLILSMLILLCVVPRAILAWRLETCADDGYY